VLANGDVVWASTSYGSIQRGVAQNFDASTDGGWTRAWHGVCSGVNYRVTPLTLKYTFSVGAQTVKQVKLWQVPGNDHQAGRVDVKYWDGTQFQAVAGQSPSGFTSTNYGEAVTLSFSPVSTSKIQLDLYSHASARNPICVGASEIEILGGGTLATHDCKGKMATGTKPCGSGQVSIAECESTYVDLGHGTFAQCGLVSNHCVTKSLC